MNIWNKVSQNCSREVTKKYSTSFYTSIKLLDKKIQTPVHSIYGFVRAADEIVDTFHGSNKKQLLNEFERDCYLAIDRKISLNPILHSFQQVVHSYNIDIELIDTFLKSMKMDLDQSTHTTSTYQQYIIGSAEVVGLMCLKVFVNGDEKTFQQLKPYAQSLGSAFQKINFLRDINSDFVELGRCYFPNIDITNLDLKAKSSIERDINKDFEMAYQGILLLPKSSRLGVLIAYNYYKSLFEVIKLVNPTDLFIKRHRISNVKKLQIILKSSLKHKLNLI